MYVRTCYYNCTRLQNTAKRNEIKMYINRINENVYEAKQVNELTLKYNDNK